MIKVKLKCDKYYGSPKNSIDADFIDSQLLQNIIDKYANNGILEVTEEVVDFYNKNKTRPRRSSHKTANALVTQLRKLIKSKENIKINNTEYRINCLAMTIVNHTNEINHVDIEVRQENNDECFDYAAEKIKEFLKELNLC